MANTCKPSTRGHPLLLSAAAVVIGIQLVATEGVNVQPHDDPPTPIVSRFKSLNEERVTPSALEDVSHSALSTTSYVWGKFKKKLLGKKGVVSPLGWKADLLDQMKSTTDPVVRLRIVKELFDKDGVGHVKGPIFASEEYRRWSLSIYLMYPDELFGAQVLLFEQLYAHFKVEFPKMLASAKCDPKTHKLAEEYETRLFDNWITVNRHHLGDLVSHPSVQSWYKELKEKNRSPAVALRFRLQAGMAPDWEAQLSRAEAEGRDTNHIWKDLEEVTPYEIEFRELGLHLTPDIESLLNTEIFTDWTARLTSVSIGQALLSTVRDRFTSDKELLAAFRSLPKNLQGYHTEVRSALFNEQNALNYDPQNIANIPN